MPTLHYDPGSFKDPSGRVFHYGNAVYRTADSATIDRLRELFDSDTDGEIRSFLVPTEILSLIHI